MKDLTKEIAEYVNLKMMDLKKASSIRDDLKIAVLSALNIAGERYEYKEKCKEINIKLNELQNKTKRLENKIDHYIID